jgi:hypothetical protein
MRESVQQKYILKFCRENNIIAVKVDSTSSRGWPDLTVILSNGTVLFVELKTETGVVSALQNRMINKIKRNNGNAYIIRSLDEFIELVNSKQSNR